VPVNLFDANFYRTANPDLVAAGLTTDAQLSSHFQSSGLNEGRAFSPLVNLNFYRASNPDLTAAGLTNNQQLFDHLQNHGVAEGGRFSLLVNINFYLALNSDVNTVYSGNRELAFTHLQNHGVAEGRRFSQVFDTSFYLATNNDLRTAFSSTPKNDRVEAIEHLFIYGLNENRVFSQFFDINYYRANNSDLVSAGFNGRQLLEHFQLHGLNEGRSFSVVLDVNYYRNRYSDLAATGWNNKQLYEHFQLSGLGEGRVSSQFFDVRYYLESNADLRAAGFNYAQAYDHFVLYGRFEGRSGVMTQQWIQQLGTSGDDSSFSVAVDSAGNVYITGATDGSLGGTNAGGQDAWLAKYSSGGALLWRRQLGTTNDDFSYGIAVDGAGNVYITGDTDGVLGESSAGDVDAWVAKYDSSGVRMWTKQLGTASLDSSSGVATDNAGNIYITGYTFGSLEGSNLGEADAWVAKYNNSGVLQWKKQLGTSSFDASNGIAIDSAGNVYITGGTDGALDGSNAGSLDTWIAKYNNSGVLQWKKQLGTLADDFSYRVAVDSAGNIYITGDTDGAFDGTSAGNADAWLAKYNNSGVLLWTRQLGTSSFDSSSDVAIDSAGNVYITGTTEGALRGSNAGSHDAWLAKYDTLGNLLLAIQLGTASFNSSSDVATDSAGNIYITGDTDGALGGTSAGSQDAWIAKYR
jgi:hypothetical protein